MSQTATNLKEVPVMDWDPYDIEVLSEPMPFYKAVLDAGPVVFFEKYGVYGVGRWKEAQEVASDYTRFTSESGVGLTDARDPDFAGRPPSALVEVDPPRHTDTRREATAILSPLVIRKWRWLFEQKSKEAVDRILEMKTFDGLTDLAEAVIFGGFPKAMGIRFDADAFRAIGYMIFNQPGPKNELYYKGLAAGAPYQDWFMESCKRENVEQGSIAEQFFDAEDEGKFAPGIAANIVRTLIRGGTDTTICGVTQTLMQLANNPDQWRILKENPDRIRFAFDEGLRMESPNHWIFRSTIDETELSGYRLPKRVKVGTFPTAANHDPRKWDNPDKFDVMRNAANVHLTLGSGIHICIGQNIARMEAECLLKELVSRVDRLEPAGPHQYKLHNHLRYIEKLPLHVS